MAFHKMPMIFVYKPLVYWRRVWGRCNVIS